MLPRQNQRWQTDGKFFRVDGARLQPRIVTYGPFPGGWPAHHPRDFQRITETGFQAIRTYELPNLAILDSAAKAGLKIFAGLQWEQYADFLSGGPRLTAAKIRLVDWLHESGVHPALAAVYVGNEIPADLVRWMGPERVLHAIEELISLGKQTAPEILFAYANFPSTEYLEPANADFTAFNIYLEQEADFDRYLKRLHHIAGDRPLVVSEFGLDSQRNGLQRQAELLGNAARICEENSTAAFTVFAWSDRWLSGGIEVENWDFGITDRHGNGKPALRTLVKANATPTSSRRDLLSVTAIVCTRNGRHRIGRCLAALAASTGAPEFEVLVVDDGSTDGTSDYISRNFPWVTILRLPPCGLSAARNAGAKRAKNPLLAYTDDDCEPDIEWLARASEFLTNHPDFAAAGGPNLPQVPNHWREAVVCAAPGAPSHVMLDDEVAEHIPGCNLVVRKSCVDSIGGFDEAFHTAGDDVDFCWRLQDAGWRIGFAAGAFVWHRRRSCLRAYLRQQIGYGKAERILIRKHPRRFDPKGSARWQGVIYHGSPIRITRNAVVYHGTNVRPAYHPTLHPATATAELSDPWQFWKPRIALGFIRWFAPAVRAWHRTGSVPMLHVFTREPAAPLNRTAEWTEIRLPGIHRDSVLCELLGSEWQAHRGDGTWDLAKDGIRILLATELGDQGRKQTLVRIDGTHSPLNASDPVKEIGIAIAASTE